MIDPVELFTLGGALLALVLVSAFFSGTEAALFSLRRIDSSSAVLSSPLTASQSSAGTSIPTRFASR